MILGFVTIASAQFNVHNRFQNFGQKPVAVHPVVHHHPGVIPSQKAHHTGFVSVPTEPLVPVVQHVPNADNQAQVLRSDSVVNPDSFQYSYETSNGIVANEEGQLKQFTDDESAIVSQGGFRYTAPDGTPISIQYVADENGYHPTGDHLPVGPPLPDHIGK